MKFAANTALWVVALRSCIYCYSNHDFAGARMKTLRMVLVTFLLPGVAVAQEPAQRLELACSGGGAANKVANSTAYAWDNYGNTAGANVVGSRSVGFDDQINLWIEGDEGRIRMPRTMLPVVRGGEDGWFKLKSIEMGEREVTASVAVNVINNPKLRIDRYTGAISISGKAGDYTGHCVKYDPTTERKAF